VTPVTPVVPGGRSAGRFGPHLRLVPPLPDDELATVVRLLPRMRQRMLPERVEHLLAPWPVNGERGPWASVRVAGMRLTPGRVAVVTGGASGIGLAIVTALAARGLTVVAVDIEEPAHRPPGNVVFRPLDVRSDTDVEALAGSVVAEHGRVDVLCANAGVVTPPGYLWEQSAADWLWTTEVNLFGVANTLRAFVPHLVRANSGHVVCTSSIVGLAPFPGGRNGAYAASKTAIVGLCEVLREELNEVAPAVGVTVLCPGPVATRIRDAARNRPADRGVARPGTPAPPAALEHGMAKIDPADVARHLCAAIEAGTMYALPNRGTAAHAVARVNRLLADLGS
jgi:NAD(P)-dependent dehydrogenase (short-subunit alcohol dehydrogenase family)